MDCIQTHKAVKNINRKDAENAKIFVSFAPLRLKKTTAVKISLRPLRPAHQPHAHHNHQRTTHLKPTDIARVIALYERSQQQRKDSCENGLQVDIRTGDRRRQPMNRQDVE